MSANAALEGAADAAGPTNDEAQNNVVNAEFSREEPVPEAAVAGAGGEDEPPM